MPRPTRSTPTETRSVTLPTAIWEFIDASDFDPVRGKPRYGHLVRFFERVVNQERARATAITTLANEPTRAPAGGSDA